MNKKDKDEIYKVVAEAVNEVVVPQFERLEEKMENELASKQDIDRIERKLDAQQNRMDRHDKRIQTLEASL